MGKKRPTDLFEAIERLEREAAVDALEHVRKKVDGMVHGDDVIAEIDAEIAHIKFPPHGISPDRVAENLKVILKKRSPRRGKKEKK
jgi:hypothetical protein